MSGIPDRRTCAAGRFFGGFFFGVCFFGGFGFAVVVGRSSSVRRGGRRRRRGRRDRRGRRRRAEAAEAAASRRVIRGGVADQDERPGGQPCVRTRQTQLERGRPVAQAAAGAAGRPEHRSSTSPQLPTASRAGDDVDGARPDAQRVDRRAEVPTRPVAAAGTRSARSESPETAPRTLHALRLDVRAARRRSSHTPRTAGRRVGQVDRVLRVVERRRRVAGASSPR